MKIHLITLMALCACVTSPSFAGTENAKPAASTKKASMQEFIPIYKAHCQGYADLADLLLSITDKATADAAAPKIAELKAKLEQGDADVKKWEIRLRKELKKGAPVELEVANFRLRRTDRIQYANCMRLADTKPEPWYGSEALEKACKGLNPLTGLTYPQQLGVRVAGYTAVVLNAGMDLQDILSPVTTKEQADAAAPAVRKITQGYRIAKSEMEVVVAYMKTCSQKDKAELNEMMHRLYFGMLHVTENADTKPAIRQYRRLMDTCPACFGSTDLQQALEEFHTVTGDAFFELE